MKKKFLLILLLASLFLPLLGCRETTTTTTALREIVPATAELRLAVGGLERITYTLSFEDTDPVVGFTSSDETVATVDQTGLVTGVAYGECTVRLTYEGTLTADVTVLVLGDFAIVPPTKTVYKTGEALNLHGAEIEIRSGNTVLESIPLTADMIVSYDPQATGEQLVGFLYQGIVHHFAVYVLDEKQEASLFDDFIVLDAEPETGSKIEFALMKSNTAEFLSLVENVYDYEEVNVYALFTSPSGAIWRVSAFWFQAYEESTAPITVNPALNLEGKVNDTAWDYDLLLRYVADYEPQFRLRFQTDEAGEYGCQLFVEIDGKAIQTFRKTFTVAENPDSDSHGVLSVDSTSNRHFVFADGTTYVPVGQNVAWYTSVQRKYYDYLSWFTRMGEVGMNYARVWMASWGYSIYWSDVENYDLRQPNMLSLDHTLEIAEDNGIYIQLCLLHHGMFSSTVNPMWPNSTNTWYTTKYGSNPYAEYLDNGGEFFTDEWAKDTFKNQLRYITARWGYSDHIMSWELCNETDWIETYTAAAGRAWHAEMAAFLKDVDPWGHMVTTSLKSESFGSDMYSVFTLDDLDYVNVHSYGIYNHVSSLPGRQNNAFLVFDKPILYDEVGYSGNGGADQYAKDPDNITLHQALWGGAMGGGAGTGMNWWWETWIETYDCYEAYRGIAVFASKMNLSGDDYSLLSSVSGLSLSNTAVGILGYRVDGRVYGYVYDKNYALNNSTVSSKSDVTLTVPGMPAGTYQVSVYDTVTGAILRDGTQVLETAGSLSVVLPAFTADLALLIVPNPE